ncbi:MAG TPA: SAM-dependent methyltransferase [Methylomirabilota bacterium]|nr:SAM-dependent methyltransferase [Methylomirabilota bacterium]
MSPDTPAFEPLEATGYLAPAGFEIQLRAELGEVSGLTAYDRLLLVPGPPRPAAWAANIWYEPVRIPIASIADAAGALRAIQRNWAVYPWRLHRRAGLIQAQLPHVSAKPLIFPAPAPTAPLGSWTLLDEHTVVASARCSSPFPNGEVQFVEDKQAPPNRAYLKLWEALTVLGRQPGPGERCLDLGASPGGWTWVLQALGAQVISVDKAPLAPAIARLPNVEFRQASAFALAPDDVGPVDWLFSDVVCYPARLLGLAERWLQSGRVRNFVCTLKFQGETDHATARRFAAIPGSRLMHLHHNKHELTWARLA